MKVPYRLLPRQHADQISALYLPSLDAAELFRLCEHFGQGNLPRIYILPDGFLLVHGQACPECPPGVLGLRALASNLFVPRGMDLVPPLLDDEAAALVKNRGLVFLSVNHVRAFDPNACATLKDLLHLPAIQHRCWEALPTVPMPAERIVDISFPIDRIEPEILEAPEEGITVADDDDDEPRSSIFAKVQYGIGKTLAALGKALHMPGMAHAGAKLMAGAFQMAPKLAASVLGRQDAKLRQLLRMFREGKAEEALRRALPLGSGTERGQQPANDARLPFHNLGYSLQNLLDSGGPASVWFGGSNDIYWELIREYRKLADEAIRHGDFRRAAFIYGKLLHDFRSAANVLSQGGFHRDAAILYLKKLGDEFAAARELEAAGEFDRALQLYRRQNQHLHAAELLRRLEEEEEAIAEFQLAANKVVEAHSDYLRAGDILLNKAGRVDLALPLYVEGWRRKPVGNYLSCAQRLSELYMKGQDVDHVLALVDEAEAFFQPAGNDSHAAMFFNDIARKAEEAAFAPHLREELRDRALMAIAHKLRQRASFSDGSPAMLVSTMLDASSPTWDAARKSDAQYAIEHLHAKSRQQTASRPSSTIIRGRISIVTAVCWSPSGVLYVGFESGEVVRFDVLTNVTSVISDEKSPILSLATTRVGDMVVALSARNDFEAQVATYAAFMGYRMVTSQSLQIFGQPWLSPVVVNDDVRQQNPIVAMWDGKQFQLMGSFSLVRNRVVECPESEDLSTAILLPPCSPLEEWRLLAFGDDRVIVAAQAQDKGVCQQEELPFGCKIGLSPDSTVPQPQVNWRDNRAEWNFEAAGIDDKGVLWWSSMDIWSSAKQTHVQSHKGNEPYLAATLLDGRRLAGITAHRIVLFHAGAHHLHWLSERTWDLRTAVACFSLLARKRLIIVCRDGTILQIPVM